VKNLNLSSALKGDVYERRKLQFSEKDEEDKRKGQKGKFWSFYKKVKIGTARQS